MGVEKDQRRGRTRYRFDVKEIEKYAGKDIPHTVIKQWIKQGKLFESTLTSIDKCTKQLTKSISQDEVLERIKTLESMQLQTHQLVQNLSEVFINLARVLLISSAAQSRGLASLNSADRDAIKRFDKAFNIISEELFPEIQNDIFFNILVKGGQQ